MLAREEVVVGNCVDTNLLPKGTRLRCHRFASEGRSRGLSPGIVGCRSSCVGKLDKWPEQSLHKDAQGNTSPGRRGLGELIDDNIGAMRDMLHLEPVEVLLHLPDFFHVRGHPQGATIFVDLVDY